MRRLVALTVVMLVVVVPSVSARSSARIVALSHPAWSPIRAEIAVDATFSDGSTAVAVMAPDGSGVRQVTQAGIYPVWSPNGNRLVVLGYDAPGNAASGNVVRVVNRDGTSTVSGWGATVALDPEATWHRPSWAPDSERLTFDSSDPTISPDGIRVARVGDLAYPAIVDFDGYAPAWSPRGDLIAYSILHCTCRTHACGDKIEDYGNCGRWPYARWAVLYVKPPSGAPRRRLFRGENAAWSSDGNLLAYTAPGGIYVARANGKDRHLLFRMTAARAGEPTQLLWAPHRPLIAFRRRGATLVIDVPKRLTRPVAHGMGGQPSWSPDGRRLVFADGGPRLYIVKADGTGGHYVTPA